MHPDRIRFLAPPAKLVNEVDRMTAISQTCCLLVLVSHCMAETGKHSPQLGVQQAQAGPAAWDLLNLRAKIRDADKIREQAGSQTSGTARII